MVRASGCGPEGRRQGEWAHRAQRRWPGPFKSAHAPHGALAQLVERQTEDLHVSGSIPEGPTKYGGMPERLKGADCKSVGLAPTLVQIQLPPPRQKNHEDDGNWQASPHPSLRVLLPFPQQGTYPLFWVSLRLRFVICLRLVLRQSIFFIKSQKAIDSTGTS